MSGKCSVISGLYTQVTLSSQRLRRSESCEPLIRLDPVLLVQSVRAYECKLTTMVPHGAKSDIVDSATRSRMMGAVKQKDTRPEMEVRGLLRQLGFHYQVRNRDLPGSPDIANRSKGWAIFVNGCFWHGHRNCAKTKGGSGSRIPSSNSEFWGPKLAANRVRDAKKIWALRQQGFRVAVVWECELTKRAATQKRIKNFVQGGTR